MKSTLALAVCLLAGGCVVIADVDAGLDWLDRWVEDERGIHEAVVAVDYRAGGTLYIVQGDRARLLRIEGAEERIAGLRVEESGDTLTIADGDPGLGWWIGEGQVYDVSLYLELPALTELRHRGRGEVKVGPITAESLTVSSSDHADTKFSSLNVRSLALDAGEHANVSIETLDADRAALRVTEYADVYAGNVSVLDIELAVQDRGQGRFAGSADSARFDVRHHGAVDGGGLECEVVDVVATHHATVELRANDALRLVERDHAAVRWSGGARLERVGASP